MARGPETSQNAKKKPRYHITDSQYPGLLLEHGLRIPRTGWPEISSDFASVASLRKSWILSSLARTEFPLLIWYPHLSRKRELASVIASLGSPAARLSVAAEIHMRAEEGVDTMTIAGTVTDYSQSCSEQSLAVRGWSVQVFLYRGLPTPPRLPSSSKYSSSWRYHVVLQQRLL